MTLDPDVAAAIERLRRKRDRSLKEVVNELLRKGLEQEETAPNTESYRTSGASLGACLTGGLDDVAEALAIAEGESFR